MQSADISMTPAATLRTRPSHCNRHELIVCDRDHPLRASLHEFVRAAFAQQHRASVNSFMPTLLAMRNSDGRICSVTGFRPAAAEPLYLEQYLDTPIESTLAAHGVAGVGRAQIVEVGNLAGASCRATRRLVTTLPPLLLARGHRWVVFTATAAVRELLSRLGAPLIDLAPALPERVARAGDVWGRYYNSNPRVMAGFLPHGLRVRGGAV
jgi:hypothetical protein